MKRETKIIAAGPWIKGELSTPVRVVLRVTLVDDEPREFIVHCQSYEKGQLFYSQGQYFACKDDADEALDRALTAFWQRSEAFLQGSSVKEILHPEALALVAVDD